MILRKRAWDIARETTAVFAEDHLGVIMRQLDEILLKSPENHTLLVKDADGRLVGTLSIWDILSFAADGLMERGIDKNADGMDIDEAFADICRMAADMPIRNIMSTAMQKVKPEDPLIFILDKFLRGGRSIAIVEEGDVIIGTINIVDIYREICRGSVSPD